MLKVFLISAVFLGIFFFAPGVYAAELYIDPAGKVKIRDAEISSLNNNVITTTLWGAKWTLFVDVADSYVKVTNSSGELITVWQLEKGHKIYVEGRVREVSLGKIEIMVQLLRDLSIAGSGPAITSPPIEPPKPVLVQAPPPPALAPPPAPAPSSVPAPAPPTPSLQPTPAASSAAGILLSRGAVGQEVQTLQETLLKEGYLKNDEVTGFFGLATEAAVKKLQVAHGLEQVGYVGPGTRKVLAGLKNKPEMMSSLNEQKPAPLKVSAKESTTAMKTLSSRLERGATGSEVELLQEALLAGGYIKDDEITGFFGLVTEAAVKKLQKESGIAQEGFTGPLTREVINSLLEKSRIAKTRDTFPKPEFSQNKPVTAPKGKVITQTLKEGMSGPEVATLQEFLQKNDWGIPADGPVTGYYGGVTSKAVANFQQANGLEAAGFVGQETRALINKLLNP